MVITEKKPLVEDQQYEQLLNEMSIRVISSKDDGLPFRITIQTPDKKETDHAHIRDLRTGKIKMGAFVITKNPPRSSQDILDWHEGITDETRELIFKWSKLRNWCFPGTNWQALVYECSINRNS